MSEQLPDEVMKKAVKGISYIAHPLRLRILEFIDVNGASSVSAITKAVGEEQAIVSQSLKKLRDANLVKTERRGLFIYYNIREEYPASIFVCIRKLFGYMTDSFYFCRMITKRFCRGIIPKWLQIRLSCLQITIRCAFWNI
ncbi:MAG: ArsR/SmtB family transcription factor [Alphaproteobacteria bacterium]